VDVKYIPPFGAEVVNCDDCVAKVIIPVLFIDKISLLALLIKNIVDPIFTLAEILPVEILNGSPEVPPPFIA
jgi:hypothetical protein